MRAKHEATVEQIDRGDGLTWYQATCLMTSRISPYFASPSHSDGPVALRDFRAISRALSYLGAHKPPLCDADHALPEEKEAS